MEEGFEVAGRMRGWEVLRGTEGRGRSVRLWDVDVS